MFMLNQNSNIMNIQPSFPHRNLALTGSCNNVMINKDLSTVTITGNCSSIHALNPIQHLQVTGNNIVINSASTIDDIHITGNNCSVYTNYQCKKVKITGTNNLVNCLFIQETSHSNGVNNQIIVRSQQPIQYPQIPQFFQDQQNMVPLYRPQMSFGYNGYEGGNVNNRVNNVQQRHSNQQQNVNLQNVNQRNVNLQNVNQRNVNLQNLIQQNVNQQIAKQQNNQFNEQRRKQMLEIRKDIIKNLKKFPFKNVKNEVKNALTVVTECSICLNEFNSNDSVILFNCDVHYFHKKCIKQWLQKSNHCPLCMHHIMADILEPGEELKL